MAKGNDGNYLQHSIEVTAGLHVAAMRAGGRLHVASAHGMAPFEVCDLPPPGQARRLLLEALSASKQTPRPGEPSIVTAYRATNASLEHYPNSVELLRSLIGDDKLSGTIIEIDSAKYSQLEISWAGSQVKPLCSSWRAEAPIGRRLAAPEHLDAPWLFTMDPMTYREEGYSDDSHIYRADLSRIAEAISSFVKSGQPGAAAIFVFNIKPEDRQDYWSFIDALGERTVTQVGSYWVTHQGGNRNLAGVLWSVPTLPSSWPPAGVNSGR